MLLGFSNFGILILRVLSGVVLLIVLLFLLLFVYLSLINIHILFYIKKKPPGTCQILNGGCDDICIPTGEGRECKCDAGSQLQSDSTTCSTSKWGAISRH